VVDIHAVNAEARLFHFTSSVQVKIKIARRNPHHSRPIAILEIHFSRTSDTLWFVQAEQTIVELPNDVFR
jgi:hypothetical protein